MNALENVKQAVSFPQSAPRQIEAATNWGRVTEADEETLFHNPDLIPEPMQSSVASLVWLARKDSPEIKKALEKYDARSLASAWVGPSEVLAKLEQNLPEKKAKLLQTYRERTTPSRQSPVFQALVKEGFPRAG
jgi:hypothetical protein